MEREERMINKITFDIETITPMFLAGADQNKAEPRAASIKGLLRFWWRALQAEPDLEELRKKENEVFGSSDEKTGGGSSFSLRLTSGDSLKPLIDFPNVNIHKIMVRSTKQGRSFPINILEYLAYGPYDPKLRRIKRQYLPVETRFSCIATFFDHSYISQVLEVFFVFGLFGGLGSRCRNGFGSFIYKNDKEIFSELSTKYSITEPYSEYNLKQLVKQIAPQAYSSFTIGTKVFRLKELHDTWDIALAEVGKIYRGIRVGEKKLNNLVFEQKHTFSKRQYIGAPLDPYQENFHSFLERHAKPYFIKIAKENDRYRGYILYLPSKYCDGLEEDRSRRSINHDLEDKKFADVCSEFNMFLSQYMDTVI
jgi:CRISPR-associated protein Cmr1